MCIYIYIYVICVYTCVYIYIEIYRRISYVYVHASWFLAKQDAGGLRPAPIPFHTVNLKTKNL